MSRVIVTVLYEDQRGPVRGFGLHELAWRCVFDDVDHDPWVCRSSMEARPMKGISKLLHAIREDVPAIAADGRRVVAVIDDDAIRRELDLPQDAAREDVITAVLQQCRAPEVLDVVLLEENAETVVSAVAACDHGLRHGLLERALRKGRGALAARDELLHGAAWGPAGTRACVRQAVPSFDGFVAVLASLVRPALSPAAES